ncbi:unnamed protein product [Gadus morhua 'NCC']
MILFLGRQCWGPLHRHHDIQTSRNPCPPQANLQAQRCGILLTLRSQWEDTSFCLLSVENTGTRPQPDSI